MTLWSWIIFDSDTRVQADHGDCLATLGNFLLKHQAIALPDPGRGADVVTADGMVFDDQAGNFLLLGAPHQHPGVGENAGLQEAVLGSFPGPETRHVILLGQRLPEVGQGIDQGHAPVLAPAERGKPVQRLHGIEHAAPGGKLDRFQVLLEGAQIRGCHFHVGHEAPVPHLSLQGAFDRNRFLADFLVHHQVSLDLPQDTVPGDPITALDVLVRFAAAVVALGPVFVPAEQLEGVIFLFIIDRADDVAHVLAVLEDRPFNAPLIPLLLLSLGLVRQVDGKGWRLPGENAQDLPVNNHWWSLPRRGKWPERTALRAKCFVLRASSLVLGPYPWADGEW